MKKLFLFIILLSFFSCDNYEYVNKATRINKSNGLTEIWLYDNKWFSMFEVTKQLQLDKEQLKLRDIKDREA